MHKEYFMDLFEYTFWADRKVWDCVMQLTDEQFNEALDYSIGSIHIQMVHMMVVEYWWVYYLATGELDFFEEVKMDTRDEIRAQWDKSESEIRDYLEKILSTDDLQREVKPPFWEAHRPHIKVWEGLAQVIQHSNDHRAQTLAGLHKLGAPTVAQDYLDYLFEKKYR